MGACGAHPALGGKGLERLRRAVGRSGRRSPSGRRPASVRVAFGDTARRMALVVFGSWGRPEVGLSGIVGSWGGPEVGLWVVFGSWGRPEVGLGLGVGL